MAKASNWIREPSAVEMPPPLALRIELLRAPTASFDRTPIPDHDLFLPLRPIRLYEHSRGRRRSSFDYRRGMVGFTPPGRVWSISWEGVLEGVSFRIPVDTLALGADEPARGQPENWRMVLTDHAPAIAYLGLDLAEQAMGGLPAGPGHFEQQLKTFLAMVHRRYTSRPEVDLPRIGGLRPQVLRAIGYIESRLSAKLDLDRICAAGNLSRAHANRCFRAELGTTVWGYVLRRRLEKARRSLLADPAPVGQIARRYGFSSPAHFCRAFAGRFGCSPGDYQKRMMDAGSGVDPDKLKP